MKDTLKFSDISCLFSIIPFLIPDNILNLYIKIIISLIIVIAFLFYKTVLVASNNKKFKSQAIELKNKRDELFKKHSNLSHLYEERINTIEELTTDISKYKNLICILEQSLIMALSVSDKEDKKVIQTLITLIYEYKSYMEGEFKNGTK